MVSHRRSLSLLLPSVADSNFKQMKTEPVPESVYLNELHALPLQREASTPSRHKF